MSSRQDSNEQTHEDIFSRDLGGLSLWIDRFVARHVAVFVYWIFALTTLLDHELASLLGEAVEGRSCQDLPAHAFGTTRGVVAAARNADCNGLLEKRGKYVGCP